MVVGFNHNFRYKGQVYHIQTEDSGLGNPHIITLLYRGGTILASEKTSYADILKIDGLKAVVEDLMKDQHRSMLRRLKNGEFDHIIEASTGGSRPADSSAPSPPPKTDPVPRPPLPGCAPGEKTSRAAPPPENVREIPVSKKKIPENSLDEIILSYLVGEEKENQ